MMKKGIDVAPNVSRRIRIRDAALPLPDAAHLAIDFLRAVFGDTKPWHLVAIKNGDIKALYQAPSAKREDMVRQWVMGWNADGYGIYFTINPLKRPLAQKPKRTDIAAAHWLWADCDPPKEATGPELQEWRQKWLDTPRPPGLPPPTLIIDSGRGFWLFWRLKSPAHIAAAEERGRGIEKVLGADHCWNADRVARLPGTINHKTGERARLLEHHRDREYELSDFPSGSDKEETAAPAIKWPATLPTTPDLAALDLSRLGDTMAARVRDTIEHGRYEEFRNDRSKAVWFVVCQLIRAGVEPGIIASILLNRAWAISEHIYAQSSDRAYAEKQIANATRTIAVEESDFERDRNGSVKKNKRNIELALQKLGTQFSYNAFTDQYFISGLPGFGPVLDDPALVRLRLMIEASFHFSPSKDYFTDVVLDFARCDSFHPVQEYLNNLKWDGLPRIETWLHDYAGAAATPFVEAVGALMLTAAVRRIRKPGCKFDEVVVLEGGQGTNKSSALALMAVHEDWFTDDLPLNVDGKRMIESLRGRWIVEAAELNGLRRGDVEHLKALLSRQIDRGRMAYDRLVTEMRRQCVIVGTTNSSEYLKDVTGNRRFWPVKIKEFDLEKLGRDRDQLWAEAAAREAQGAPIRLPRAQWAAAAQAQSRRAIDDPFHEVLARHLGEFTNAKIPATAVWDIIGVPVAQRSQDHNARLGAAMRKLGWVRVDRRFDGKSMKAYVKGNGKRILTVTRVEGGAVVVNYDHF